MSAPIGERSAAGSKTEPCRHCGHTDGHHVWSDGDCVLRHASHSRRLVEGTFVCVHCVDRHKDELREITELYATLEDVLLAGSVLDDDNGEYQKPRKRPASPSPLRLAAWAMHWGLVNDHIVDRDGVTVRSAYLGANLPDVPHVLTTWVETFYEEAGWGAAPDTVTGATAALSSHADRFARSPHIDDYDAELRWLLQALRAAHGVTAPKPLGRCMSLGCTGRVWPAKDHGNPQCDRCARRYGHTDLVKLKITEEGQATA